jgi:hypothetical protein
MFSRIARFDVDYGTTLASLVFMAIVSAGVYAVLKLRATN